MAPSTRSRRPPRAGALAELSPTRIVKQILLLQAAYYSVAVTLILFTTLVAGQRFGPGLILDWRSLRGDTAVGWTLGLCWMMDSLVGVIFLLVLVSRSKLVPDFALTVHALHLLVTSVYTGSIPSNVLWWGLQVCSAALMTGLGIWTCRWRELQPMAFGGGGGAGAGNKNGSRGVEDGVVREGNVSRAIRGVLRKVGVRAEERGGYEMVGMEGRVGEGEV
ncbi:MAG: hypothetical protein MMC23_008472 [Stictis urceolatum]|nr:hypothetical protein [Stictis urceolata]